ncbi:MAG: hypothetical protein ABJE95_36005, partial [Byssovorax sp.]
MVPSRTIKATTEALLSRADAAAARSDYLGIHALPWKPQKEGRQSPSPSRSSADVEGIVERLDTSVQAEVPAWKTRDAVDLERGIVDVPQSMDHEGNAKPTKTAQARRVPIEAALLSLLRTSAGRRRPRWGDRSPCDRHLSPRGGTSPSTRSAGDRITWLAIRGDDPSKVMARGPRGFRDDEGYVREAELMRQGFGELFAPLPPLLAGEGVSPGNRLKLQERLEITVEAPGIEP